MIDMPGSHGEQELLVQVCTAELIRVNELLRREIDVRRLVENEHVKRIENLLRARENVKTLRAFIPLCAYCNHKRDDSGCWSRMEPHRSKQKTENFHSDN